MIGDATRFQLIEEPKPLLRERSRHGTLTCDRDQGRDLGGTIIGQVLLDEAPSRAMVGWSRKS